MPGRGLQASVSCDRRLAPPRPQSPWRHPPRKYGLHRHQNIRRVFCPASERPRALTASIAYPPPRPDRRVALLRKRLAKLHEEGADQWPEAPPTFMTSVIPIAFSISGNDLSARPGSVASTASNPASCSIRDRRRRLPGPGWSVLRRVRSSTLRAPAPVFPSLPGRDSCRDPPAIRIEEQRLVEAKRHDIPGAEPASGSDNVTGWPPRSRWRWLWSPRCSIRLTVACTSPPPRGRQVLGARADGPAPACAPAKRVAGSS